MFFDCGIPEEEFRYSNCNSNLNQQSVVVLLMSLEFLVELPCFLQCYIYFEGFQWELRSSFYAFNTIIGDVMHQWEKNLLW